MPSASSKETVDPDLNPEPAPLTPPSPVSRLSPHEATGTRVCGKLEALNTALDAGVLLTPTTAITWGGGYWAKFKSSTLNSKETTSNLSPSRWKLSTCKEPSPGDQREKEEPGKQISGRMQERYVAAPMRNG